MRNVIVFRSERDGFADGFRNQAITLRTLKNHFVNAAVNRCATQNQVQQPESSARPKISRANQNRVRRPKSTSPPKINCATEFYLWSGQAVGKFARPI
jgi:hypothetical protein